MCGESFEAKKGGGDDDGVYTIVHHMNMNMYIVRRCISSEIMHKIFFYLHESMS